MARHADDRLPLQRDRWPRARSRARGPRPGPLSSRAGSLLPSCAPPALARRAAAPIGPGGSPWSSPRRRSLVWRLPLSGRLHGRHGPRPRRRALGPLARARPSGSRATTPLHRRGERRRAPGARARSCSRGPGLERVRCDVGLRARRRRRRPSPPRPALRGRVARTRRRARRATGAARTRDRYRTRGRRRGRRASRRGREVGRAAQRQRRRWRRQPISSRRGMPGATRAGRTMRARRGRAGQRPWRTTRRADAASAARRGAARARSRAKRGAGQRRPLATRARADRVGVELAPAERTPERR